MCASCPVQGTRSAQLTVVLKSGLVLVDIECTNPLAWILELLPVIGFVWLRDEGEY